MDIPTQYRGLWQGVVKDSNLVKPYPGEIHLNAEGGETTYRMAQYRAKGLTKGLLATPREEDGWIILNESLYAGSDSWGEGTLSLKLIGEDWLECNWNGAKGTAHSRFTRKKAMASDAI